MQTSFKDVRCINSGAIPLPRHGRQVEVDESQIRGEEVRKLLIKHNPGHPPILCTAAAAHHVCMHVPGLQAWSNACHHL